MFPVDINCFEVPMKSIVILLLVIASAYPQVVVTDFDGNNYSTITIGTQVWLRENLKSLHYCDGVEIPGTVGYFNSDSLINIYGRLYTWNAAMRNSTVQGAQGVCPCGWHVPSDAEWIVLENFLGGASIAGGKLKEAGTIHWKAPNTGADNSSGFTALPAGEYDDYYTPRQFRLLNEYAVFWTSTEVNSLKARERYIAFNSAASSVYDWYKVMKYSIRCIKDSPVGIENEEIPRGTVGIISTYPNPFNVRTTIRLSVNEENRALLRLFNVAGENVYTYDAGVLKKGINEINVPSDGLADGVYIFTISAGNSLLRGKINILHQVNK